MTIIKKKKTKKRTKSNTKNRPSQNQLVKKEPEKETRYEEELTPAEKLEYDDLMANKARL